MGVPVILIKRGLRKLQKGDADFIGDEIRNWKIIETNII